MSILVCILIMMSVYMATNKTLKSETKTTYFIGLAIIGVLFIIFSIL